MIMESLQLNLQSEPEILPYMADHCFVPYEKAIFGELLAAIAADNQQLLDGTLTRGITH